MANWAGLTRSPHHGTSTEWSSSAMKLRVAAATWTAARQAIGLSAMWRFIWTPYSSAMSPIFFVSIIPPAVSRSGCTTASAPDSRSGPTPKDVTRRLVDFLSGVAYALDGKVKKIAANTYIITPANVDLVGDLMDELENSGLYF